MTALLVFQTMLVVGVAVMVTLCMALLAAKGLRAAYVSWREHPAFEAETVHFTALAAGWASCMLLVSAYPMWLWVLDGLNQHLLSHGVELLKDVVP